MTSPLGRVIYGQPTFQDKLANLIRVEKPSIVVETGVWEGLSTEFILTALDDNGHGHLYSIDPMDPKQEFNGTRGKPELFDMNPIVHPRFTLIREYSSKALMPLYFNVGDFDFFLHDSDHGFECQSFEYEAAWHCVRSGGIIATDDPFWGEPPHHAWDQFLARHGITERHIIGTAQWVRKP